MKQDQFDHLTRALVNDVSRREFLKLLVVGVGGSLIQSLGACRRIDNGGGGGIQPSEGPEQGGEPCTTNVECCSATCINDGVHSVCENCTYPGGLCVGEICEVNSDCCSGQCVSVEIGGQWSEGHCVTHCSRDCTQYGDGQWIGGCRTGPLLTDTNGKGVCCKDGYWEFETWDRGSCRVCINGKVFGPVPGVEKCCNGTVYTRSSQRVQQWGGHAAVSIELLTECEDCDERGKYPLLDGEKGLCGPGQSCCHGVCIDTNCYQCQDSQAIKKDFIEICGGKCYEHCKNGKPRAVANNCECEKCQPCPPNKSPISPESCDCKCTTIETCKDDEHFFNQETCKCECKLRQTCKVNQVWDEKKCACECPQITCPGGQELNPLCECDCPAGKTWCASQGKCVDTCTIPGTALDPDDCQCKDTFGCREKGNDDDFKCPACKVCKQGQCVSLDCGPGRNCCEEIITSGGNISIFDRTKLSLFCIDFTNDMNNCGSCQNTCLAPQFCENGRCRECSSSLGETYCNGTCCPQDQQCCPSNPFNNASPKQCTDVSSNVNFCGSCNQPNHLCSWDEICEDGRCHSCNADNCEEKGYNKDQEKWVCETCVPDLNCCNKQCVRFSNDPNNCGGCYDPANPTRKCPSGYHCCNGGCRDVRFDNENCGACSDPSNPTNCQSGYYCCNRKCIPVTDKCQ